MSLSVKLRVVYLHNARLRHLELQLHLKNNKIYTSEIEDFDQYTIIINDGNYKLMLSKRYHIHWASKIFQYCWHWLYKQNVSSGTRKSKNKTYKTTNTGYFLNEVRKYKLPVNIIFKDELSLEANIMGFDNFVILVDLNDKQCMLYKNNVSYVHPLNQTFEIIKYTNERRYGT